MLKIIKADEPIEIKQIVVVIYGQPGLGKSSLGFTAESPLLIDFDHGAHRAAFRGDSVGVDTWQDVSGISTDDFSNYKTVVVDTAGRALDILTMDIIKRNPKLGRGGALTLQGYGALKSEFTAWLKMLRLIGKDVVLIAHSNEEKNGDDIIERLDVQGGSKGEIYKSADAMGRLSMVNRQRVLNFSPTDTAFGKNPGKLDPTVFADGDRKLLGDVIASIKSRLNALTQDQAERQKVIADWTETISEAKKPNDFNALIESVRIITDGNISKIVKGFLHSSATSLGFIYDKTKGYVEVEK